MGRAGKRTLGAGLLLLGAGLGALWSLQPRPHATVQHAALSAAATTPTAASQAAQAIAALARGHDPDVSLPTAAGLGQPQQVAAPLALERSPGRDRFLFEAEERATRLCMEQRGFTYSEVGYESDSRDEVAFERVEPDDEEAARAIGYGLATSFERPAATPTLAAATSAQSAAERARYDEALLGPDPHGRDITQDAAFVSVVAPDGTRLVWHRDACASLARRRVYGEDDVARRQLELAREQLFNDVEQQATEAPSYASALERWRSCMIAAGQPFDAPASAVDALANDYHTGRLDLEQLRDREREIAASDARCTRTSEIKRVFEAAREAARVQLVTSHSALVEQWQRSEDAAVTRAAQLLGRDPSRERLEASAQLSK